MTTTLWIDAQAYQPLRSVMTTRGGPGNALRETDTTRYQILPATPANLNLLTPPIPADFTQVPSSPHF